MTDEDPTPAAESDETAPIPVVDEPAAGPVEVPAVVAAAPEHPAVTAAPVPAAITAVAAETPPEQPEAVVAPAPTVDEPAPTVDAPAPTVVAPAAPVSHRATRRRRWPWVLLACVLATVLLIAAGGLWYVSGLIGSGIQVRYDRNVFPLTITAADQAKVTYTGPTGGWVDQGLMGVATIEGGYVQTRNPSTQGAGSSATTTREVITEALPPVPTSGQAAGLDGAFFPRNPQVGLGVQYQDVDYTSPAGPTPAWYIPGTGDTWVIFTHGLGGRPNEGLRIASTVTKLGYPMLLIKYRNDPKAPSTGGQGTFGVTEWPDLEAAVKYSLDHGAKKVVLAGASMGGAITLAFLHNSPLASSVTGAWLDAPAVDFASAVRLGAADMGIPDFVTSAAMQVASWRYGIDWAATDYTALAPSYSTPTTIVQGTADQTVPAASVEKFAAAANPTVVKLELFDGAAHVMSWNMDRPRYEELLTNFLAKVAPR